MNTRGVSQRIVQTGGVAPRRFQYGGSAPKGDALSIDVKGGEIETLMRSDDHREDEFEYCHE
jgi:hypothetical protein